MLRQLKRTGGNEAIERLKYEQQVKSQRAIEEVIAGEMKRKRQQNEEIRGQKIIEQEEVERILSKANGEMYSNENDAGVAIEEEYEYDDKENEEVRFVERFNKEDIVPTIQQQQQQQQQQLVDSINSNTGIEMHIDKGNEPTMTVTMTEMEIDMENLFEKVINPKPEQQPNHSSHTLDYQLPPLQTISPFSSQQSPTIKQNSSQKNEFKPEPKTASEFSRQPDLLASGKTINSKLGEELGVEIGRGIASKPLRYSESRSSIGIPTTPDSSTPSKKLLLWISQFTHNNNNNNNNNNSSHSSDFPTNITTNSTTTNTSPLHTSSPTTATTATNLSYITQQPKILQYLKVHRGGAIDPNLLSNIPPAELFQRVLMTLDKLGLVVVSTKGLTIRVLRPAKLSTHYNPNLVVGANYPFDLSSISNSASVSNRYDYLFKTPQTTASPSANTDSFFQLQKALSLSPDDLNPSNDKVSTDISLLTNTLSVTNVKIKHTKPTILVPDRTLTLTPTDGSSADRGIHSSYSAPKDLSLKLPFSSYKKKLSSSNSFSSRFSVLRNSILRKSSADKKAGFFEPPPPSPSSSPSSSAQTNNNNNNTNTNLHLSTATNAIKPSIVPSFSSCSSSSISYSASKSPPNLPNSSSTPTPTPSSSTSQPPTQPPTQNSTQNSTQSSTQNSTPPPPYGQASNDNGGEVQFIIEICKLKSLSHLFVVSISRRRGNTWSYKYLYNLVADNLNLKDSFDYINSPYTSIILKNN
ncbi:hypothetical protein AX774_g4140 [Zancudomyces culisetae]|uniref:KA1 domain-containing protein n=1 Tax=Zancudomyces culisetae TaxID=1213189 RepID=A0A1R1PN37_ZANCU|nr:hypothetical protein AX774_g4140 [Zancudomyces culisetae]|eukprot:OMH82378.1 hypothetical protein AX774_g4140 [Zancudomyces culisetae]